MKLKDESKELAVFLSIAILVTLIFSFVTFGITGLRVVFGIIFVSLPFYSILTNFDIENSEKIVFSVLLGLTLFPVLTYLLGFIVPFRIAIVLTFIIFVAIAAINHLMKNKK